VKCQRWGIAVLALLVAAGCRAPETGSGFLGGLIPGKSEPEMVGANSSDVIAKLQQRKTAQESSLGNRLLGPIRDLAVPHPSGVPDELVEDRLSMDVESAPSAALYFGVAAYAERSGNLEQARIFYDKALKLDRHHIESRLGMARVALRQAETGLAEELYASALRDHPESAAVRNDVGLFRHQQGRLDEARIHLEEAVRLDPDNRRYRNNLAALQIAEGYPQLAERTLIELVDPATAYVTIAEMSERRGHVDLARDYRLRAQAEAAALPANHPVRLYFAQREAREMAAAATGTPVR